MSDQSTAVNNIVTDAVLWYNVGVFGEIGYGVPNPSNDIGSLNPSIADITSLIGRNLFLIMHHEDVDLTIPPSINTLFRIHQLYKRAGQILSGRAVAPGTFNMETDHVTPAGDVFRVWPVPFYKVRNVYMKRWANWIMVCLAECFQHTENRKTIEISTAFAAMVGKYLHRVYSNMAIELFGKTATEVADPAFLLTDADFSSYDPAQFFTPQEMIDTVPALDNVFTEDRKAHLAAGILVSELPALEPYPGNLIATYARMRVAKESEINPDTGAPATDGSRITAPVFPSGTQFVA